MEGGPKLNGWILILFQSFVSRRPLPSDRAHECHDGGGSKTQWVDPDFVSKFCSAWNLFYGGSILIHLIPIHLM